jgi:lipopolysaccharide/colanic/teichoic acid biosynthesis glycosyltransferase
MKSDVAAGMKQFEPGESSRVTRFGKLLRKAKVDELPELLNVLLGQMSLVGARPEVDKYVRAFPEEFDQVLRLKPGLSDLASIRYRNEEKVLEDKVDPDAYYRTVILPEKLRLAEWYAKNSSFKTDVQIIGMTLKSIFGERTGRHERWIEACVEADAPSTRVRG